MLSGFDCRAQDFSSGLVVSNATVGGDSGPFFTPLFWTRKFRRALGGTCRVLRAPPTAADSPPSLIISRPAAPKAALAVRSTWCELWLRRHRTAGSPVCCRPVVSRSPPVPSGWPLSAARRVVDRRAPPSVPVSRRFALRSTGRTAYMTIMGFTSRHLEDNGAGLWIDFSEACPTPLHACWWTDRTRSIRPDVGVFASSTPPVWTEVGPARSGQPVLAQRCRYCVALFIRGTRNCALPPPRIWHSLAQDQISYSPPPTTS